MKPRALLLPAVLCLSWTATACTPSPGPTVTITTTVTQTVARTATLTPTPSDGPRPAPSRKLETTVGTDAGDRLGTTNMSSRRVWSITGPPDEAVALARLDRSPEPPGCNPGGCEEPTTLVVTGRAPGTTTVTVAHQRWSGNGHETTETVTYEVTVSA